MTFATDWLAFCFAVFMAWVTICLVVCFVGWVLWAVFDWHQRLKDRREYNESVKNYHKMLAMRQADDRELQEAMRHV